MGRVMREPHHSGRLVHRLPAVHEADRPLQHRVNNQAECKLAHKVIFLIHISFYLKFAQSVMTEGRRPAAC